VKIWPLPGLLWIACTLLLAGSLGAVASDALPAASVSGIVLDIPTQSLASALYAYSAATAVEVIADGALVSGRQSAALKGTFTPEEALRELLAGTGLTVRRTGEDAFVLVPLQTTMAAVWSPDPPPAPDYVSYSARIQAAMKHALCRLGAIQPGGYRVAVQLWISPSGTVTDTSLLGSTGNNDRDAVLSAAMRDLVIGASPPAGLPQPITLVILPRSPAATGDCRQADGQ
jgi:TonB family protein